LKVTVLLTAALILLFSGCFQKVPLSVTNGLERYNIHGIYISRSNDTVWGTNHLPGTDILTPGRTAEVMVIPGTYDLRVSDQDGDSYSLYDIRVGNDGFNWTVTIDQIDPPASSGTGADPAIAGSAPLLIRNDLGSWDITGVWISPADSDSWGNNHIEGEILRPGDTYTAYVRPAIYDIYLEDEDGDTYTRWEVLVDETGYTWNAALSDIDSSGGG
jgi:hypothetical protein